MLSREMAGMPPTELVCQGLPGINFGSFNL